MLKKIMLLLLLIFAAQVLFADLTGYPRTVLGELFTTAGCGPCPDSYAGLAVVHSRLDYTEFISIRYYSQWGLYGSPEIQEVFDYYGVESTPHAIFNGVSEVVGAGPEIVTGGPYLAAVDTLISKVSPLKMEISAFDPDTGDFSVDATMLSPDVHIDDAYIRFVLVEDDLTTLHTKAVRRVVSDSFNLSGQNNTLNYTDSFDLEPAWVNENLHMVAFVQQHDYVIVQAISTYPAPEYKLRPMVPFSQIITGPSTGMYETDYFALINFGLEDDYTIELIVDSAPEGWTITYCDQNNCYIGPHEFSLGEDEYEFFGATIMPSSEGTAYFKFQITSANSDEVYLVNFTYHAEEVSSDEPVVESKAVLHQNYPNPFNPQTTISFQLPESSEKVALEIYSIDGRLVRRFQNIAVTNNEGSIVWDGRDHQDETVSSGVYMYRLLYNDQIMSKKMLLIK